MKNDKLQNQTFLTAYEYNKMLYQKKRHGNCLSFAFGQTSHKYKTYDLLTFPQIVKLKHHRQMEKVDICDAFIKKAKEFGYEVKQISSLDEASGQVSFIVFGWYTSYIEGIGDYEYFFHIIRRNKNSSFEHKLDWDTPANTLTSYELNQWLESDIKRYYFVVS